MGEADRRQSSVLRDPVSGRLREIDRGGVARVDRVRENLSTVQPGGDQAVPDDPIPGYFVAAARIVVAGMARHQNEPVVRLRESSRHGRLYRRDLVGRWND